jgi:hypothetical protein
MTRNSTATLVLLLSAMPLAAQGKREVTFELVPNPTVVDCLKNPDSDKKPAARVIVERGELNDVLILEIEHIKPRLAFDLFTVQRSSLTADAKPDPNFTNFGLAWYQSDVQAGPGGEGRVVIRTILLDQIFGFDPDVRLPPTNTFHVGFWFNNPEDAQACGFDVTKPTPFNGEHRAGPLAMISLPNPDTGLGPLCTNPDLSSNPIKCNP